MYKVLDFTELKLWLIYRIKNASREISKRVVYFILDQYESAYHQWTSQAIHFLIKVQMFFDTCSGYKVTRMRLTTKTQVECDDTDKPSRHRQDRRETDRPHRTCP